MLRSHGTLTAWNDDRGFGFIADSKSEAKLFVHISAFPRDGVRPRIGELISYEVVVGDDGKRKAEGVIRPAGKRVLPAMRARGRATQSRAPWAVFIVILCTLAGAIGYAMLPKTYVSRPLPNSLAAPRTVAPLRPASAPAQPQFRCDGRTHCSQMGSFAEAQYFLANCPGTKMDGDRDGEPCERQFQ